MIHFRQLVLKPRYSFFWGKSEKSKPVDPDIIPKETP